MKNRLIKETIATTTPGAPTRGVPFPGISPQSPYCYPVWGSEAVYEDTFITTTDPNTGETVTIPHKVYKGVKLVQVGEQCTPGSTGVSWGVMGGVLSATVEARGGQVTSNYGGGNTVVTPPPRPPGTSPPPIVLHPPSLGGAPIIISPPPNTGGGGDSGGTVESGYGRAAPSPQVAGGATESNISFDHGPFLGYLYPGDPGLTPAVTTYNLGWDAGAISIVALPADCIYTFTVPRSAVGVVTGLNDINNNPGYIEIDYAFYLYSGHYKVMEKGAEKTPGFAYTNSDVFAVVRRGTEVTFWKNSTKVYSSIAPSTGPVFVDASLYAGGDSIIDAKFLSTVPVGMSGSSGSLFGVLPPLQGFASDGTVAVAGTLGPLVGVARGNDQHIINGILPGLRGEIFGDVGGTGYATVSGKLTTLTGRAEGGLLQPPITIVNGVLTNLVPVVRAYNGTKASVDGILDGLHGFAADNDGAYCEGILAEGMVGVSTDQVFDAGNALFMRLPLLFLHGIGHSPTITGPDGQPRIGRGFYGTVPKMQLSGTGGGAGIMRLPTMQLAATGTAITIAHLDARLPTPTLSITGTYHIIGGTRSPMRLPTMDLIGYGGGGSIGVGPGGVARGALVLPKLRFVGATGTAVGAGALVKRLPKLKFVEFTGTRVTTAALVGTLPLLRFVPSANLVARLPMLAMRATGKVTITVEYEAYSFTLMPQTDGEIGTAATRLTHHPFERIVRYRDRYYGVAVDGIYLLEGDNYAGEPIVAVVQTGSEDYDRPNLKRLEALWFSGRCGADMNVAAISAEYEEPVYYMNPDKVGARAQRVEFGRGTEARYWAIRFTNLRGEDFQVENAASEITVLKRTHGGPS